MEYNLLMSNKEAGNIFDQTANVAAEFMQSRVIVDIRSGNRVRIEEVLPYQQVGSQYRAIEKIPLGYLWTPRRRTLQSLVVLKPEFKPGSCVRILRSSYYDMETGSYVLGDTERNTAEYLGMSADELARLEYNPEAGIFHLFKGSRLARINELPSNSISAQDADRDLDKFLL